MSYCTKTIDSLDDVQCVAPLRRLTDEQKCHVVSHIQEHLARRKEREKNQRTYEPAASVDGKKVEIAPELLDNFQWWTEGVRWMSPKVMRRFEAEAEAEAEALRAADAAAPAVAVKAEGEAGASGEGGASSSDDSEAGEASADDGDASVGAPPPARRPRACHSRPRADTAAALDACRAADAPRGDAPPQVLKRARTATAPRSRDAQTKKRGARQNAVDGCDSAARASAACAPADAAAPSEWLRRSPAAAAAAASPFKHLLAKLDAPRPVMDPFWVNDVPWNAFFDEDQNLDREHAHVLNALLRDAAELDR